MRRVEIEAGYKYWQLSPKKIVIFFVKYTVNFITPHSLNNTEMKIGFPCIDRLYHFKMLISKLAVKI